MTSNKTVNRDLVFNIPDKPESKDFIAFKNIKVLKYPLKDNKGKVIRNLNFYQQLELVEEVSRKWKCKVRHLTLAENFQMSKLKNEYWKNVLKLYWVYTGEIFERKDEEKWREYMKVKGNSDHQWDIHYDEKGKSAVGCCWGS